MRSPGVYHTGLTLYPVDRSISVAELREHSLEFPSEPIDHESGMRRVYCHDQDGITAELLQMFE